MEHWTARQHIDAACVLLGILGDPMVMTPAEVAATEVAAAERAKAHVAVATIKARMFGYDRSPYPRPDPHHFQDTYTEEKKR